MLDDTLGQVDPAIYQEAQGHKVLHMIRCYFCKSDVIYYLRCPNHTFH